MFDAPASKKVQDGDGALGPYSPVHAALQGCCDHSFADLSEIDVGRSDFLAYDINEKNGLLKWLGPVYDPNEARAASRNSSSDSSRGSSGSSWGGSSADSKRKNKKPHEEEEPPRWVVANVLYQGADGMSSSEIPFPEGTIPKYWLRPFGELLLHGKAPRPGSFGVAYVVLANPDGSLMHRLQFGQVLGMKNGRYIFWAPHLGRKANAPGTILLSPARFAPVFVDEETGHMLPKVQWVYDAAKHARVPEPEKASTKTQKSEPRQASVKERLSTNLVDRLKQTADTCHRRSDATGLVKELESTLQSEQKARKAQQTPHKLEASILKQTEEEESARRARAEVLRRQLESTQKLLQNKDPSCAHDIRELLAQEEADRCRHRAARYAMLLGDVALRKTIEREKEWDARRAISTLIASSEENLDQADPVARKRWRQAADGLKGCSVKILAPSERNRALPKSLVRSEMEAASMGHGFSKAAEEKLLRDCTGTTSLKLIKALLQNKGDEHDVHEWEEIKESLSGEKGTRASRSRALHCEQTIDALVRAVRTKGCREVLLEALRKAGVKSNRADSASDLGKLFSLKVKAARKGGRVEALRAFQDSLRDERVHGCLDALDLPDLEEEVVPPVVSDPPGDEEGHPEKALSKEEEAMLKSCDYLDEASEELVDKIMQASSHDAAQRKSALEELLKRLSQTNVPDTLACKAAVETMHASLH